MFKIKKEHISILVVTIIFMIIISSLCVESAGMSREDTMLRNPDKRCGNAQKKSGPAGPEKQPPTTTPTTSTITITSKPFLTANPNWVSVLGYSDSFNQCNGLCSAYQQHNCDSQFALQYCNAVVQVDLNKDGKISSSEIGNTPSSTRNCETNARCYDVIPSCACGNSPLNIASCINMLYQAYMKTGLSAQQALQNVKQETTSGCHPPQT